MSNPSRDEVKKNIADFFILLCHAHGWSDVLFSTIAGGYRFSASKTLGTRPGFLPSVLELRLELAEDRQRKGLFVSGMNFRADENFDGRQLLHPQDFLSHHGMRFYSINPEIKNTNCWHIGAPKDLNAFLEGYDRLAKRLGRPTLFE